MSVLSASHEEIYIPLAEFLLKLSWYLVFVSVHVRLWASSLNNNGTYGTKIPMVSFRFKILEPIPKDLKLK